MAQVRLDNNGIPKGPVFEAQPPGVHRSGVTAVDSADPADASAGVNTEGYQFCRFDLTLSGVGVSNLTVQVLFWNPRQNLWFGGASRSFSTPGRFALMVEGRGAILFLKVTAFSGTSFTLSADYGLC